ncbi:MAG: apolipoprotein N-acyltransferase [Cumulibacter sp.]
MRRLWVSLLVAAGAGSLLALAFPPNDLTRILAIFTPALYALAVEHRRWASAALVTFVGHLVFYIFHVKFAGEFLGPLPWFALAVWQASYFLLLGPALVVVRRLRWWPIWAAACWVAIEALQGRWPFGGFPWGKLAFSQDAGPFTPFVAYGGTPLLSFVVALCGFGLAAAWFAYRDRPRDALRPWRASVVRLGCAALIPIVGLGGWLTIPDGSDEDTPHATVAVIQGNVPREGLDFNEQRRAVLDNHVNQTLALAEAVQAGQQPQPSFVLWPENSSDIDPYRNEDAAALIQQAADAVNAPILVGAVVSGPGEYVSNMAILWLPQDGPDATYTKRHPVPFAEYMPIRGFLEIFTDLVDMLQVEFYAGEEVGVINVPGAEPIAVGDVICFEVAYDGLVADVVDGGAQIITVQTNNATFGHTNEPHQQLAMSRIRAVEYGRTVLSASTSGVSAIIAPDGEIWQDTGLFEPAILVASVPLREGTTVAAALRWWPELVITIAALAAFGWGIVQPRRRAAAQRRSGESDKVGSPTLVG